MIPILAQLSVDHIHPMVQFLIGGSATVFLLNQGITFWKEHLREKPAPADTYATKTEFDRELKQTHGRISREREEINQRLVLVEAVARAADAKVTTEVKAVEAAFTDAVSRIRADGEGRVYGLQQKMDDMLREITDDHKTDADALHGRITDLLQGFSELKGEVRAILKTS